MFSKMIVIPGIVLYFIYMCSFCFGVDLYTSYKMKILLHERNLKTDIKEHKVCETSGENLVFLCNHAFLYLRKTYLKYKNTLYVNYKAFEGVNNNICKTVVVKLKPQHGGNEEFALQHVLPCYARGPIDESLDMYSGNYPFYDKIVIYPYDFKNLMIFEQTENRSEFILLDWMENIYWKSISSVDPRIFRIPVPVRKELPVSIGLIQINPSRNILTTARFDRLHKICTLLYGRQPYSQNFIVDTYADNFRGNAKYEEVFLSNERTVIASTHICAGFLANVDPPVRTQKYKLMPGLKNNDVILIIYNNERSRLEAIELISNLYTTYIDLMFLRTRKRKLFED